MLRLPVDIEERLTGLVALTGRTKTYYATQAIIQQLEDIKVTISRKRYFAGLCEVHRHGFNFLSRKSSVQVKIKSDTC